MPISHLGIQETSMVISTMTGITCFGAGIYTQNHIKS